MNLVMRHENESPAADTRPSFSFSSSHLSNRVHELKEKVAKSGLDKDFPLEDSTLDADEEQEKKKRAADKYLKMYGVNTAPNRYAREFFGDDEATPVARASRPSYASGRQSLGISQSADWRTPSNRSPSRAKLMAQKYLQQRQDEREHEEQDNKKPKNLRVDPILGDGIGMI